MIRRILGVASAAAAAAILFAAPASAGPFSYLPPGDLIPTSGQGRVDYTVYAPGMRFPMEVGPAFANSQVYNPGGSNGGPGGQCSTSNYDYPWRDNYCEIRTWSMPLCPSGTGHQGQDIRAPTCEKDVHWVVAAADGTITNVGSYSVYLTAPDGTRYDYLHMGSVQVTSGQAVSRGQRIGKVSNEFGGTATTIHLHVNLRQNVAGVGTVYVPPYMSLIQAYEQLIGGPVTGFFAAKYVSQSFPLTSQGPQTMYTGEIVDAFIELENIGTSTWDSNTMLATTEPRDRISVFAGPEWPAPNRYAAVAGTVPPGGTYTFAFKMHAPLQAGTYDEFFGVVQEGQGWFSDPGHGGPPDNQLEGLFEVVATTSAASTGAGAGSGSGAGVGSGSGAAVGSGSGAGVGAGGASSSGWGAGGNEDTPGDPSGGVEAGCACSHAGHTSSNGALAALLGLAAAMRLASRPRPARCRLRRGQAKALALYLRRHTTSTW